MSGGGLLGVRAGGDDVVDVVGGYGLACVDELLVPGAGARHGQQGGAVFERCVGDDRSRAAAPDGNLVAAYAFDEGAGTTVADLSGNGNTGTMQGASWSTLGSSGTP